MRTSGHITARRKLSWRCAAAYFDGPIIISFFLFQLGLEYSFFFFFFLTGIRATFYTNVAILVCVCDGKGNKRKQLWLGRRHMAALQQEKREPILMEASMLCPYYIEHINISALIFMSLMILVSYVRSLGPVQSVGG